MNNAIKTDRTTIIKDVYAFFDRLIDIHKTFAYTRANPSPLTRKEMNYMLIRSVKYNIPARVTHI
jgi:hypothetical protein